MTKKQDKREERKRKKKKKKKKKNKQLGQIQTQYARDLYSKLLNNSIFVDWVMYYGLNAQNNTVVRVQLIYSNYS